MNNLTRKDDDDEIRFIYLERERSSLLYNLRIEYFIINKIIDSYVVINGLTTEIKILKALLQSTPRPEIIGVKKAIRFLKVRRYQFKRLLKNHHQPIRVFKYKQGKANKPYSFNYQSKFKVLTEKQHSLHATNWTAEQERRELLKALDLQPAEVEQLARGNDLQLWEAYELLEYFTAEEIETLIS